MIQTIIQTFVTATSLVVTTTAPVDLPVTPIQVTEERLHVVKQGESLSKLALTYYNNSDAWTSILNDNPEITDPDRIEEGTMIKVRYIPQYVDEDTIATHEAVETPMHESVALEASEAATEEVTPANETTAPQTVYVDGPLNEEQLTYLGQCEAGMDPTKNTGNGYYGAFQFSYGTWKSMGTAYERADLAPLEVQKDAVQRLLSRSSIFTQFPGCAKKMRLLGMI